MIEIAHSVPGRLRIVVRDLQRAEEVRKTVVVMRAVKSATLNAITGSIVIVYDPATMSAADLWQKLRKRLARIWGREPDAVDRSSPQASRAIEPLISAVVDASLRYLIERSATALLAGLI